MAVLSACETGVTTPDHAIDEYAGLPAAFLSSGVKTVVSSFWKVDDLATAWLMERFHLNVYEKRMRPAQALRDAQRWLRGLSWEQAARRINKWRESLSDLHREDLDLAVDCAEFGLLDRKGRVTPFCEPVDWAAFQCVGVGW